MNEKHIELAKKLHALANKGVGGEALNARAFLQKLCAKHGITMDQLEMDAKSDFRFTVLQKQKQFFYQVCASVLGKNFRATNPWQKSCTVECTASEAMDIKERFNFYWKIWEKEQDIFYRAFIQANDLYARATSEHPARRGDLSEDERKMLKLAANLDKHSYLKRLNQ